MDNFLSFFIIFSVISFLFPVFFFAFSAKTPNFARTKNDAEMRKFLLSMAAMLVFAALLSGTFTGCKSEEKKSDTLDTSVVNPQQLKSQQDENTKEITGVAIDGSSNTVTIQTEDGQEKIFDYNKDNYDSDDLYNWDLDENNKIKVTYVEGENGDSVVSIQKAD